MEAPRRVWGVHEIDRGLRFRIGPCHLVVIRHEDSWQVAERYEADGLDTTVAGPAAIDDLPDEPGFQVVRYGVANGATALTLEPALPDRPVVARPQHDVCFLPRTRGDFYVGVVLWARVAAGEGLLTELPLQRPLDTWFGPSAMEGELCYASPTALLTKVSEMRPYPHRAVVPVSIDNRGAESVWLHRLRIPAPNLMLYSGKHGRLWTERVTLVRERGSTGDISEVRIAKGPPVELGDDVGVAADARIEPGESWRRCSARCSDERRSHAAPEPGRARELVERRRTASPRSARWDSCSSVGSSPASSARRCTA